MTIGPDPVSIPNVRRVHPKSPSRIWVFCIILGTGCIENTAENPTTVSENVISTNQPIEETTGQSRSTSVFDRPLQRLSLSFKVHRISSIRGAFDSDSELWNIVTGTLPDAESVLQLAANGFRAAVGRESDREALLHFLHELEDPRSAVDHVMPDISRLVVLDLGPCEKRLSVFYYDPQGNLHGLQCHNAQAKMKLAFDMRSTNLKEIWLRVVPELEEPQGRMKWELDSQGRAQQVPDIRRHTFENLFFEARIPEGGFLLLAPTAAVYESPLLGRPFFIDSASIASDNLHKARENIYIISPIIQSIAEGNARHKNRIIKPI